MLVVVKIPSNTSSPGVKSYSYINGFRVYSQLNSGGLLLLTKSFALIVKYKDSPSSST